MRPARSAVLRDVLVLVPGEEVSTIDVSPVVARWEIITRVNFPSVRTSLHINIELRVFNTAAGHRLVEEASKVSGVCGLIESRLREDVRGLVVSGVVLLFLGSLVPFLVGPGILGSSPGAVALNSDVVGASDDTEETFFSPVMSP